MTFDKLTSALNQGGQHLGDLIWWTLAEARIDRSTLEKIWAGAQLAPEHLPDPPTAEKALKAAVREAAVGQPDRLIRLGKEDEAEIVFAVVRETKHADGSVTYQQETRIVLDRKAESVSSDIAAHDLAGVITTRFGELRSTHTPDDVRRAMMKTLDACAAVTLRDHGGVYWVPAPYAELVRRLQTAIEKIGSSRVYLLPVHASADANRTLGDAAKLAIEDELAALKTEVEGFMASPPDRPSTLVRRLDAFEALKMKAALYRDVLQVRVQDLEKTLEDLTGSVEHLLNEKVAA
ncbi:DUF6744 family protein [Anaeromyxobacter sp. SG66]|uniref:DUF6744 family protein n=1 Tax=Anaeromyxobacter sp. SG66 TaxID=2925410 RepID=UPI001F59A83C|nr:DUF6744 family protein [Anaeromyxobacter sp. SG66]